MTIDLKWGLPFALPVLLLFFGRLMVWLAGATWDEPGLAVLFSMLIGMPAGVIFAIGLEIDGRRGPYTFGKRRE